MPYEILNSAQVTPHRLHALLRLLAQLGKATRGEVLDLLQPSELVANQDAAKTVLLAASTCQLVIEQEQQVTLNVPLEEIATPDAYMNCMQGRLLGVVDEAQDNYLLNMFAAWYAVQDDQILRYDSKADYEGKFNSAIYPGEETRAMNATKINGWETWAAFLGWGWFARVSGRRDEVLIPDAYVRIRALLDELLPNGIRAVDFADFASRLSESCPELDGGELFELCWRATRASEVRGNQLSLTLSTALRGLHQDGNIVLERQADARELWWLFPAEGHPLDAVSHIRRGG